MTDFTPRLTIGMATYDDFDGVYFTITSLLLHHAEVLGLCEIVVIDNNPTSKSGRALKCWLEQSVPNGRYYEFCGPSGTAQPRNEVFRRATAEAVLCLDCHVLLVPGAIARLIQYYAEHPGGRDLLVGPLLSDSGKVLATHQDPIWREGAWGVWSIDERGKTPAGEPFEVWQQGMGLFSCRKAAWVGFHPEFRGFGGCESYVMEKVRRNGGRVLCCPWLGWTHRFERPNGIPYHVGRGDKLRNYVIGFQELGLDLGPVTEHFGVSRNDALKLAVAPRPPRSTEDIAVVGVCHYGGVRMRGSTLSRYLGCRLYDRDDLPGMRHVSTVIAVKDGYSASLVRRNCDRLIYDPLDDFCSVSGHEDSANYWRKRYRELSFDDILATSPACYTMLRDALPDRVQVHLVPHAADPRINRSWANPDGPIVYSGLRNYIQTGLDRIERACRNMGRQLVLDESCDVLKDASLVLALRLPPYHSELNRSCKPQVKIANAIAAGLPVVATDCPATTSLFPDIQTVPIDFTVEGLVEAMRRATTQPVSNHACHVDGYLATMNRILGRETIVVYTGIFGGYDQLREPCERVPGVQYLCFTDNPRLKSEHWSVHYVPSTGDPQMQSKACKVLAHQFLDCDISLWIDGRLELQSLNGVLRSVPELGMFRHPRRNCIYAEAAHCQQVGKGDPRRITQAVERYRREGHPRDAGLWMAGTIIRRHTAAIQAFNCEWWKEIVRGTARDQISLPVVLRRLRQPIQDLQPDAPRIHIGTHLK